MHDISTVWFVIALAFGAPFAMLLGVGLSVFILNKIMDWFT